MRGARLQHAFRRRRGQCRQRRHQRVQAGRVDRDACRLPRHRLLAIQQYDRPSLGFQHHHLQHHRTECGGAVPRADGAAGMVRSRQHHLRPDLRRREHHLHPQRHDARLYQRQLVQQRRDQPPQTVNISTDWITTDGGANDGKTGIDSYGYQTYIHEIGHALGLGHQGPTTAARPIRPTRSMPTTPGNIPSCRISRNRTIPGVRTAT